MPTLTARYTTESFNTFVPIGQAPVEITGVLLVEENCYYGY